MHTIYLLKGRISNICNENNPYYHVILYGIPSPIPMFITDSHVMVMGHRTGSKMYVNFGMVITLVLLLDVSLFSPVSLE